ncbi:MAG: SOS response-associated peptidase [Chloroflexota bacterium]|nr:MAG: SOS response-associated peptidase [Chloroflexota bacterium]
MCGRFTLTVDPGQLQDAFPWVEFPVDIPNRYNIAPTQPAAVVPNDGLNRVDFFNWGLIPFWAKDPKMGQRMINARSETISEKPTFRGSFKYKRCLVLADGFYEWRKEPGSTSKTPMYLRMKDKMPFAFAGLWDVWQAADGSEIRSFTIITTEPNSLVEKIHNRMPVILAPDTYREWLKEGENNPELLRTLLRPYPSEEMEAYAVSKVVNSPQNDSPECIIPVQ